MSADLHIHIRTPDVTDEDMADFFSHVMGSKYCDLRRKSDPLPPKDRRIDETPNVWIGEVSWLKAALFDDADTYVPDPVVQVSQIIGEDDPVIDDELIEQIVAALDSPNETAYRVTNKASVLAFLKEHRGKPCFTISW